MTHKDAEILIKGATPVLKEYIARELAPLEKLQQRVKDLEEQLADSISFRGVHQAGKVYGKGSAVTRQGGLWIALCHTSGTPGGANAVDRDWVLAVKRGSA